MESKTKKCQNCKADFTIEPEDFEFYEKIGVPEPGKCPRCRQQHRILFRNFKTLYKRESDKSGKPIISQYSEKAPFPVYATNEWWSDDWDAKDYGREVDFNRPFFDQINDLWQVVPRANVSNVQSVNCQYSNMVLGSKNCYLVFGCVDDEDCAYGHIVWNSTDCLDCLYVYKSELCYECIDVLDSSKLFYSQESENCFDSVGLFDCKGCSNCIGCVSLRQKNYHIFNEKVGKEKYKEFLKEHPLHNPASIEFILSNQLELRKELPHQHFFGSHNSNVTGNHIYNSRNVFHGFDVKEGEDSKSLFTARKMLDSHDVSFSIDSELAYHVVASKGRGNMLSHNAINCTNACYSDNCFGSNNIFGCAGLRSAEYCILNKQYSKEEFNQLRAKIVEHMKKTGEWGEYFAIKISPFAYNESIVSEYMPLTKQEAIKQGFRWEGDIPATKGQETIDYEDLPRNPKLYTDSLTNEIFKCRDCEKNYRLIPQEISFFKKLGLPIPDKCFNCRHQKRMDMRNPRMLWPGACSKCGAEFETSYSPKKQKEFKIYCHECYLKEVV